VAGSGGGGGGDGGGGGGGGGGRRRREKWRRRACTGGCCAACAMSALLHSHSAGKFLADDGPVAPPPPSPLPPPPWSWLDRRAPSAAPPRVHHERRPARLACHLARLDHGDIASSMVCGGLGRSGRGCDDRSMGRGWSRRGKHSGGARATAVGGADGGWWGGRCSDPLHLLRQDERGALVRRGRVVAVLWCGSRRSA